VWRDIYYVKFWSQIWDLNKAVVVSPSSCRFPARFRPSVRPSKRSLPLDPPDTSRAWRPSPVGWRKRPVPNSSADRSRLSCGSAASPPVPKGPKGDGLGLASGAFHVTSSLSRGQSCCVVLVLHATGKENVRQAKAHVLPLCRPSGAAGVVFAARAPPLLLVLHTYSVLVQSSAVIDQLFLRDDGG